jgi:tetratricopeptide (TPR) repeat protein
MLVRIIAALLVLSLFPVVTNAQQEDVAKARDHYKRGTKAYDLGRYLEAAREYETAYEIKDDPALLYNIAQAYRLGGDHANALRSYRSFLRRLPNAPNRPDVETKIAELQKVIDAQAKAAAQSAELAKQPPLSTAAPSASPASDGASKSLALTASAPPRKQPLYKQWWPWTIGGVVLVGVAVGVGVGVGTHSSTSARVLPPVNGNP